MFTAKKNKKALLGIMEQDEFHMILKVERARADRDGPCFSLVLFEMSEIYTEKYIKEFVDLLKVRIRLVDFAGWFDGKTIGVILFSSDIAGANRFILDIEKKTRTILPAYTIFSYPDHWINSYELDEKNQKEKTRKSILAKEGNSGSSRQMMDRIIAFFVKPIPLWKRIVDIIGSFIGLLFLTPLFVLTAVYIKIVSPGPVFFKQKRVGHKGELFTFLKFRTMNVNNDVSNHKAYLKNLINNDNPMEKLDNKRDPRIIPGGEILRKTCIDELPQLINVLRGEMSLIGPRPCIQYEANEFSTWHRQRFNILPGMTGLWQVSGKNNLSFKQMIRLDINYGEKMSLMMDIKILLLTVPTVFGLIFEKLNKKLQKIKINRKPLPKTGRKILDFNPMKYTYRGLYVKERSKQSV